MSTFPLARRRSTRAGTAPGAHATGAEPGQAVAVEVGLLTVGARLTSVPRARAWAAEELGRAAVGSEAVRVAVLLTSELVTNAVRHGPQPGHIRLRALHHAGGARIEVADGSPERPLVRTPGPTATSGRGMSVVSRLSTAWGVDRHAAGKTVWFEVGAGLVGVAPHS